jgi:hypothetical protein
MAVELTPAAAGARVEDDVFFEIAAVVEEVEAWATDTLDGVLTCDRDHHRWGRLALSLFGGGEPSRGRFYANGGVESLHFALDIVRRRVGGDSIEDKTSPPFTDKRASNRELGCLESLL